MYAHVENSSITYMGSLPVNWRNISGLNKSKDDNTVPESVELKHHVREMNILEKKQRDDSIYSAIRVIRTEKLFECDWTMVSDSKLSEAQKTEWVNYRQQLRDLPATADITKWNTSDWVWPTPPE